MTCARTGGILMPPKGKWDICPEEKGRMSIMNKKVLGIAAAAAAAGGAVYAASKVKKQAQAQEMRREKESLQSRNYGDKQVYLVGGCIPCTGCEF